ASHRLQVRLWYAFVGLYVVVLTLTFYLQPSQKFSEKWISVRPYHGPYDERSTATALVRLAPAINSSDVRLRYSSGYISEKDVGLSGFTEIHIGHVKD